MTLGKWIGLFALIVALYILWQIRQVILLLFVAVVLATVLNRFVERLQRSRIKRGVAVALSVFIVVVLIAGFFALAVPPIIDQFQKLVELLPQALERLRGWLYGLQNVIPQQLIDDIRNLRGFTQNLQTWGTRIFGNFFTWFNNSIGTVLNILLVLVLTVMLLVNPSPYRRVFILAFPAFYRRRVAQILSECESSLVGWIKGTLFNMFVIGLLSYIGLRILNVPLPFVNAILAGLLEFIPNLGPTLSVIPPMLLALLNAPWKAGAVLVMYIVIQQLESLILVPFVMQETVSLLPAFTLLAVVIFAAFFGFLGLFMAVPLLIVSQIWIKEVLVHDILNKWHKDATDDRRQDFPTQDLPTEPGMR
ncbi:AI-2E family transporter [Kamptonema formosum]|uniref:AI-2E family transporter n=1 Tax=Kamptonema formosum TaxID=331992 RepID=UPI00034B25E5|nr:AI-2E family transporter [Oscillatoria sp. PCC 10802]